MKTNKQLRFDQRTFYKTAAVNTTNQANLSRILILGLVVQPTLQRMIVKLVVRIVAKGL